MRVFLLLLILLPLLGTAQDKRTLDSLHAELKAAPRSRQFDVLNAIGFAYRYSAPDSTVYYCNRALDLGRILGMKTSLARPLSFIGLARSYAGDYHDALNYHNQAIEMAIAQHDTIQMAHGYNNLGRLFFDQGDLVRAYNNFVLARDFFESLHDSSGLAYVHRSLAGVFKAKKDYPLALEHSQKALQLRQALDDPRAVSSALMELGLVYQELDTTPLALKQFYLADSIATAVHDPATKAELTTGMAEIYLAEKQYDKAWNLAQKVLESISENTNQKIFLRARLVQGRSMLERGDAGAAVPLLLKVLHVSEASGNHSIQRETSLALSLAYRKTGDVRNAAAYENMYQILEAKILNADLNREIERLQFQLAIEKAEAENAALRSRQARDEVLIARQRYQFIGLGLVATAVAVIAGLLYAQGRRRKKLNGMLEEQNRYVTQAREEIARQNAFLSRSNAELDALNHEKDALMNLVAHDLKSPLQQISGLVGVLEKEGGLTPLQLEYVRRMHDSTRNGLQLITTLLHLRKLEDFRQAPVTQSVSIHQMLADEVSRHAAIASAKQITINRHCSLRENIHVVPEYLIAIADNLLSNAIKFSKPGGTVEVGAHWNSGLLVLEVSDSGPGFTEEDRRHLFTRFKRLSARPTAGESSTGLGLAIVKVLVDRLHGEIRLSTSSTGSTFTVSVPAQSAT